MPGLVFNDRGFAMLKPCGDIPGPLGRERVTLPATSAGINHAASYIKVLLGFQEISDPEK